MTRRDPRTVLSDAELAALRVVGIAAEKVFRRIEEAFGEPDWFVADTRASPVDPSLRQAVALRHRHIGTDNWHILLGLLSLPQPPLADLLVAHGITYDNARERVLVALNPIA